jgi:hypothetical protein
VVKGAGGGRDGGKKCYVGKLEDVSLLIEEGVKLALAKEHDDEM